MLKVCHQVRGRLRLRVPGLLNDHALAGRLTAAVGATPGVIAARTNPSCGSLVVHHDPGALAAVRITGLVESLLPAPAPASLSVPVPVATLTRRPVRRPPPAPPLAYRVQFEMVRRVLSNSLECLWYDLRFRTPPDTTPSPAPQAAPLDLFDRLLGRPLGLDGVAAAALRQARR